MPKLRVGVTKLATATKPDSVVLVEPDGPWDLGGDDVDVGIRVRVVQDLVASSGDGTGPPACPA